MSLALSPGSGFLGRIARGTVANGVLQVINTASQFLLVPLYLHAWGPQRYGEWLIVTAAVTYFAIFDFGLQTYMANRLNQCHVTGDMAGLDAELGHGLSTGVLVAFAAASAACLIVAGLPVERWLRLDSFSHGLLLGVTALLALQLFIAIAEGLVGTLYRSSGDFARGVGVNNAQRLATLVLVAGVLAVGGGYALVALAQLAPFVVGTWWVLRDVRRRYPYLSLSRAVRAHGVSVGMLVPSSLFLLIQLSSGLVLQGGTIVVGAVLGAGAAAVFATTRTLTGTIRQLVQAFIGALAPELTSLEAVGSRETLALVHTLLTKVTLYVTILGSAALANVGSRLLALWTGGKIAFNGPLVTAMLLGLVVQTYWSSSAVLLTSANRQRPVAICCLVQGLGGTALAYWLAGRCGLSGAVYGYVALDLAVCAWAIPWVACRLTGQPVWRHVAATVPASLLLSAWLCLPLASGFAGNALGATYVASMLIAICCLWRFGLDARERSLIATHLPAVGTRPA